MNDLISQNNSPAPIAPINSQTQLASQRQVAEVMASLEIAQRFPRNTIQARARLIEACQRPGLAEKAIYEYPRGGQKVDGPSIRLAEAAAQCWGNLDFGIVELEQRDGESTVMAFAWDKETNTRQTKVFNVPHTRKSGGRIKTLDDPRDIYEMVANQGARRLRACILGVIPGDIIEDAVAQCNNTMLKQIEGEATLEQTISKMIVEFKKLGVTAEELEAYLGHNLNAITPNEVNDLRKKFQGLVDGFATKDEYFKPVSKLEKEEKLKAKSKPKSKPKPKPEPKPEPIVEEQPGDELDMGSAKEEPTESAEEAPTEEEAKPEPPALYDKVIGLLSNADIPPHEAVEVLINLPTPMLEEGQQLIDLTNDNCKKLIDHFGKFEEKVVNARKDGE